MQVAWVEDKCIQCGVCVKACRNEAITLEERKNQYRHKENVTTADDV